MAVAILPIPTPSISSPFLMPSRQHINVSGAMSPAAPSSRSSQPPPSAVPSPSETPGPSQKPLQRIRYSLEQSFRTATRRTKHQPATTDDAATATTRDINGRLQVTKEDAPKERDRSNVLKSIDSKGIFRRGRRESIAPSVPPPKGKIQDASKNNDPTQVASSSFVGSLRQASISSPTLLASQAFPAPISRYAHSPSPSKDSSLITPSRDRVSGLNTSQRPPNDAAAAAKRPSHTNGTAQLSPSRLTRDPSQRHQSTQSGPVVLPPSPSSPSLLTLQRTLPPTPTKQTRDPTTPPHTPTYSPGSRNNLASSSRRHGASSSSHLPLGSPPTTPTTIRGPSPIHTRSPSSLTRVTTTPRGFASASTSHLPPSPIAPTTRRASVDSHRYPSDGSRTGSPSSPSRRGPSPFSASRSRHLNTSTASLASPSNPDHRELIRHAISLLCKELSRPPHPTQNDPSAKEAEARMAPLLRHERIWGMTSGPGTKQPSSGESSGLTNHTLGLEDRERRLFVDALRDGVVLCLLINKLRSKLVVRPDLREDGTKRSSNVDKFLAACASRGLSSEEIFQPDDLKQATSESLARVARTIVALIRFVDAPPDKSKYLSGQVRTSHNSPYSQGTTGAAASTPNFRLQTSSSPSTPTSHKRQSPPSDPTAIRPNSPDDGKYKESSGRVVKRDRVDRVLHFDVGNDRAVNEPLRPPRSPLRARRPDDDGTGLFTRPVRPAYPCSDQDSVADSTAVLAPESIRESLADPFVQRQSTISGTATDTTMFSSLLESRQNNAGSKAKYGTIRTVTTEATSESPSFDVVGGSYVGSMIDEAARKQVELGAKSSRQSRQTETRVIERVPEEVDRSSSSSKGGQPIEKGKIGVPERERDRGKAERIPAIHLGKGKWPDDFIGAIPTHNQPHPNPPSSRTTSNPLPTSLPTKPAVANATNNLECSPPSPGVAKHRATRSIDTALLLPKQSPFRDPSPDGIPSASGKVALRRNTTKPNAQRNRVYVPRNSIDDRRSPNNSGDSLVPFPRGISGEHGPGTSSPSLSIDSQPGVSPPGPHDKPLLFRGRFQSDVEGSTRRPRPSSYDELGARPTRSRFESMVNLGVATTNASASDLLTRNSMDGSAVRKTLIVREPGKPPTRFQLGNFIGRGQFGSVYRALNLNTGQMVAVKRIPLEGLKEAEVTQLMREVDLVKSLSHPSIVKYEGMTRDDDTLNIVLEYAESGSLGQTLKAFGKLNESLVASYVVKILEGLHYLHQCNVVHCDLKAANILTTKNGNIKLADFGVSLNLRAMARDPKDVSGTPNWMAPEVIELKGASTKSDIWSLACTVIELLTGRPPYSEITNGFAVMWRIVMGGMPPIPEGCTPLLRDFLVQCFNKDPTKRPDAEQLCEHEWLKNSVEAYKELHRKDSIPFLRRVSREYQKSGAVHPPKLDIPDPPDTPRVYDVPGSPSGRRLSDSTTREYDPISPREHSFVKTIFGKPMICTVCHQGIKKNAVFCGRCSLISHTKCSDNAPPTCNLREQLLLYAQYADKGNPATVYYNPLDILRNVVPISPTSPTSESSLTPGTPLTSPDHVGSPTAFKWFPPFRRPKTTISSEQGQPSSPPPPSAFPREERRKAAVLKRKETKRRPQSVASDSTITNTSSMRSAATASKSFSSRLDARTSVVSIETEMGMSGSRAGDSEGPRSPLMSGYLVSEPSTNQDAARIDSTPPESSPQKKRNKDSKSGCNIQ